LIDIQNLPSNTNQTFRECCGGKKITQNQPKTKKKSEKSGSY